MRLVIALTVITHTIITYVMLHRMGEILAVLRELVP